MGNEVTANDTKDHTPESRKAFRELLDTLWEGIDLTSMTAADENDSAEGYRWMTHFMRTAIEQFFENDPDRPRFVPLIMPKLAQPWAAYSAPMEIWSPNPYTIYDWAPLAPGRRYRITGKRGSVRYVSFALYSGTEWNGKMPPRIGDWINMLNLECEPDGSFEITIGERRPAGAKNFLEADPDMHSILIRQFFADERNEEPARYMIEVLDHPGPAPRLNDSSVAHRLRSVIAFIRETGVDFLKRYDRPFPQLNYEANKFDLASLDNHHSNTGRAVRGGTGFMYINPDHWYLFCNFDLQPGAALLVDLVPPQCHWWGLYANNRYMSTFEYTNGGHNLVNIGNAVADADGVVHIVLSATDHGLPNWIDTGGQLKGTLTIRWTITGIDPGESPSVPLPTTRVVKDSDVPLLLGKK